MKPKQLSVLKILWLHLLRTVYLVVIRNTLCPKKTHFLTNSINAPPSYVYPNSVKNINDL